MGFASKLGEVFEGFSQGLPRGVQLGAQLGGIRRQDERYQASQADKKRLEDERRLRARYAAGDRQGAIDEALRLGYQELSQELQQRGPAMAGQQATDQATQLQASVAGTSGLGAPTTGVSPEDINQLQGNITGARSGLAAGIGGIESIIEQGGGVASPTVIAATDAARRRIEELDAILKGLGAFEGATQQFRPGAPGDELEESIKGIETSMRGLGLEDGVIQAHLRRRRLEATEVANTTMLQYMQVVNDPDELAKLAANMPIDINTERLVSARVSAMRKAQDATLTDAERASLENAKGWMKMAPMLYAIGDTQQKKEAEEMIDNAADAYEDVGLKKEADDIRRRKNIVLGSTVNMDIYEARAGLWDMATNDILRFEELMTETGHKPIDKNKISFEEVSDFIENVYLPDRFKTEPRAPQKIPERTIDAIVKDIDEELKASKNKQETLEKINEDLRGTPSDETRQRVINKLKERGYEWDEENGLRMKSLPFIGSMLQSNLKNANSALSAAKGIKSTASDIGAFLSDPESPQYKGGMEAINQANPLRDQESRRKFIQALTGKSKDR